MPLHDWANMTGWDGMRLLWISELARYLKPRLPAGYRVYVGTTPVFSVSAPVEGRPDVGVTTWPRQDEAPEGAAPAEEAGWESEVEMSIATPPPDRALHIEREGLLISAIELVSPRNKDRQSSQTTYTSNYAAYLLKKVHLLLVDVHRRPLRFSFAERIAAELTFEQPALPTPFALAYRVGAEGPRGGRFLARRPWPLAIGEPLPTVQLPLSNSQSVLLDLEQTYGQAADTAYLD
jgi:hypothetical protein